MTGGKKNDDDDDDDDDDRVVHGRHRYNGYRLVSELQRLKGGALMLLAQLCFIFLLAANLGVPKGVVFFFVSTAPITVRTWFPPLLEAFRGVLR